MHLEPDPAQIDLEDLTDPDGAEKRRRQAHIFKREAVDWYSEPDWVWHRFFEVEPFHGGIHDPSCGRGNVVQAARFRGHRATGSDIAAPADRGNPASYPQVDFLDIERSFENICSNPPFNLIDPKDKERCYLRRALAITSGKVALLLPTAWINARSWLRDTPLFRIYFLTPRPSMPPGHMLMAGKRAGSGTKDFAIFVWLKGYDAPPNFRWLHRDEGSQDWR